jgi:hypothetical protein
MTDKLTHEQIIAWQQDPITKLFFEAVKAHADTWIESLANGTALEKDMMKPGGVPWVTGCLYGLSYTLHHAVSEIRGDEE